MHMYNIHFHCTPCLFDDTVQSFGTQLLHVCPQRRRAAHERLEGREVVLGDHGVLGEREHDGRHHIPPRHPVLVDGGEKQPQVEGGQQHHVGDHSQREHEGDDHAEDVEEGQGADQGTAREVICLCWAPCGGVERSGTRSDFDDVNDDMIVIF